MPRECADPSRVVEYNGHRFVKDAKRGYYLSSKCIDGRRRHLHRYVWELYNGPVPGGYEVHHKDENKDNNDIGNLEPLPKNRHTKHHMVKIMAEQYKERRERFIETAHPEAKKWHRSKEGRDWHQQHFALSLGKSITERIEKTCTVCDSKYSVTASRAGVSRFCSKKCKAQKR